MPRQAGKAQTALGVILRCGLLCVEHQFGQERLGDLEFSVQTVAVLVVISRGVALRGRAELLLVGVRTLSAASSSSRILPGPVKMLEITLVPL